MLFNSYSFLFLFLPLALLAWWTPQRLNIRLALLVLASYVFYGWWDWRYCGLMFLVTCAGYLAGERIAETTNHASRKTWLIAAIAFHLGLLGYFKYAGFFTRSLDDAASGIGLDSFVPTLRVVLPIGISFYIFESLSYIIDIYRGKAHPARSFLHFMLFISIFPKLIAGPIIRYTDVEAQYDALPRRTALRGQLDYDLIWQGLIFFLVGLFKKVVIADQAAQLASQHLALDHPRLWESWVAVGAYTIQIYFDFSGYSDMAVGLGLFFGFRFPQNFNRPYLASDITQFWDRWHITLSRWLRDYLFIPLGGSRNGTLNTVRNLTIVMFLGGLWHGASWTYVVWGLYHGVLLAGYHTLRLVRGPESRLSLPVWPARAVTLIAVMFGWALFVSPSFGAATDLITGMLGGNGIGDLRPFARVLDTPAVFLASAWILFIPEVWDWRIRPQRRWAVASAAGFVICIGALGGFTPFIYYQF